MLSTVRFLLRHKTAIATVAAGVGAFIGIRQYSRNFHEQWQSSESRNFVAQSRQKKVYFDEALTIGGKMINDQYRLIIKKVHQLFFVEEILTELGEARKNNKSQKEQLKIFEQLKVEIFLLIVSEVYVLSFFVTYLRIMLSIVSGKMYYDKSAFESEEEESEGDPNVASILRDQNSQYFLFVSLLENFNQSGVEHLVEYIRKTAKPTLAQVNVVQNITINDLLTHLIDIEGSVSSNLEDLIHDNAAVVFPFNNLKFNGSEQEAAVQQCRKLIDEMFDIVSLPDFRNVLKKCISIGFSNLSDFTYSCYVHYEERKTANCRQNELMDQERKQFINPHTIAAPLVKLLPSIWSKIKSEESLAATATNLEFSDQQKSRNTMLIEYLQCLDSLTCLSANIYESFCNENLED